jgi:tetratricopeptide (TPR) repeat protein
MDLSLFITLGVIFLITLIGAYLRSTVKERCLKSFTGFNVTLERADGKIVWGKLRLEPSGIELLYPDAIQDEKHLESSYVLYASEYHEIQAIYRYADALSLDERARRDRNVYRAFHPSPFRRMGRGLRNFLSTATNSLNEVLNVVVGRVQKTGGRYIADGGGASISKLGSQVLGQVGSIHDPMLESLIGRRVVAEWLEDNEVHEHVGILQDYSADFLLLLDVQYPQQQTLTVDESGVGVANRVTAEYADGVLQVNNLGGQPLLLGAIKQGDREQMINGLVDGGETLVLHLEFEPIGAQLSMRAVRELDLIVPRTRCLIRHRAEAARDQSLGDTLSDIVFDLGVAFSEDRRREAAEARLRETLVRNPKDAAAAAALGGLLVQKQAYDEAEKWLRQALSMEESLPDGGRRARMQLRELQRRSAKGGATSR